MKELFLQIYGATWFAASMLAIAGNLPAWGPFVIGGTSWMLAKIWVRSLSA